MEGGVPVSASEVVPETEEEQEGIMLGAGTVFCNSHTMA